jgi:excisionase family DNA binding protein
MTNATKQARPRKLGEDELLTTAEVASLLRITGPAVRTLIESGRLPATRPTRHYRVWRSDVERLLAVNRTGC